MVPEMAYPSRGLAIMMIPTIYEMNDTWLRAQCNVYGKTRKKHNNNTTVIPEMAYPSEGYRPRMASPIHETNDCTNIILIVADDCNNKWK